MIARHWLAFGVNEIGRGKKDPAVSGRVRLELVFEPVRMANVVRVKQREIMAAALRESPVVADGWAGIVLAKAFNPIILIRTNPLQGGVGRPIVDDDQLPILEGLAKDAFYGRADVCLRIVGGHADGNKRAGLLAVHSLTFSLVLDADEHSTIRMFRRGCGYFADEIWAKVVE